MRIFVRHIISCAVLLCLWLAAPSAICAEAGIDCAERRQQAFQQHDAAPVAFFEQQEPVPVLGCRQIQRVGASRVVPAHGWKTGRNPGRGFFQAGPAVIRYVLPGLYALQLWHSETFPSPRSYYVIALRRILC